MDAPDLERRKFLGAMETARSEIESAGVQLHAALLRTRAAVNAIDSVFRGGHEIEGASHAAGRRAVLHDMWAKEKKLREAADAELAVYKTQFDGDLVPDEGQAAFDLEQEAGHALTWVQRDRVCREIRRRRLP